MKNLLTAAQFDRPEVEELFAIADGNALEPRACPWLMASLFFEPSTRTRLSFEAAALRLFGRVLTVENGAISSSMTKGESLADTIRTVSEYVDLIVLRHPKYGAASEASYYSKVPVVNAGDGKGNHPTQALLDAYTIYKELGSVDGRRILIWGDIEHARTVNSLLEILRLFDVEVHTWNLTDPIGTDLIASSDVIYMTRPQVERHSSFDDPLTKMSKEYNLREDKPVEQSYYGLQKEMLPSIKDDAIILHPLPRTTELPDEVMNDPRVVVFKQAKYGVAIRKAVLQWALK